MMPICHRLKLVQVTSVYGFMPRHVQLKRCSLCVHSAGLVPQGNTILFFSRPCCQGSMALNSQLQAHCRDTITLLSTDASFAVSLRDSLYSVDVQCVSRCDMLHQPQQYQADLTLYNILRTRVLPAPVLQARTAPTARRSICTK
jgi:hypothetical protein